MKRGLQPLTHAYVVVLMSCGHKVSTRLPVEPVELERLKKDLAETGKCRVCEMKKPSRVPIVSMKGTSLV